VYNGIRTHPFDNEEHLFLGLDFFNFSASLIRIYGFLFRLLVSANLSIARPHLALARACLRSNLTCVYVTGKQLYTWNDVVD
jgi:hypothetical protein